MDAFHVSEQMTATGSGQELRGNYRQETVLGHTNLHREQLLVLCERLGLDTRATAETLKERIEGWANYVVPTVLISSQAPMGSGKRPILRPTCPAGHGQMTLWRHLPDDITFNEEDWFKQESRAGYMADQPRSDVQALYREMERKSVNVDDWMQRLRTDGANGGSSVASSPPPQCPASVEGQARYM